MKGKKTGGRRAGTPNKRTAEAAALAEREVEQARANGRMLAKEVLDKYMHIFAEMADFYQPTLQPKMLNGENGEDKKPDEEQVAKFDHYAELTVRTAKDLAPYQSPTYRAIVVAPAPDTSASRVTRFQLKIIDHQRGEGMMIEQETKERMPVPRRAR